MITVNYVLGKKHLYEYVIQVMLKKWLLFGAIVGVFGTIFYSTLAHNTALLTVSLICLLTTILLPPLTVWEMQRRSKDLGGSAEQESTVIFGDSIKMIDANLSTEISYQQIKQICETKHLYAFMIAKNAGIVIPKDKLSVDDYKKIKAIIAEKKQIG